LLDEREFSHSDVSRMGPGVHSGRAGRRPGSGVRPPWCGTARRGGGRPWVAAAGFGLGSTSDIGIRRPTATQTSPRCWMGLRLPTVPSAVPAGRSLLAPTHLPW